MKIFSSLFKKLPNRTQLEEFLQSITLEQPQKVYRSMKKESLRLPAALSVLALYLAHRFAVGLRQTLTSVDKSTKAKEKFAYDAVAFEAAAFCHYRLMQDVLDHLDVEVEDEIYFEYLKDSATITSSLFVGKTPFSLPRELLLTRSMAYSHEEKFNSVRPDEKFAKFLISSIQSGTPTVRSHVSASSSLSLQLSIISYVPIFESTLLDEFKKVARDMFLADREGSL